MTKLEWRSFISDKRQLGVKTNNQEMDAYFNSLDTDGGGSLDLIEIKKAVKALRNQGLKANMVAEAARKRASQIRERADLVKQAAEATALAERQEKTLEELIAGAPLDQRLGQLLIKRNLKVGEVVKLWDKDGDGTVTSAEFCENVLQLGLNAHRLDLEKLFCKLDTDGEGDLDLEEVKKSFSKLIVLAHNAEGEVRKQTKESERLKRIAGKVQANLASVEARDEELAREKAAAEMKAAEARAREEAAAIAAAEHAREQKEAAKLERKRLMEERARDRGERFWPLNELPAPGDIPANQQTVLLSVAVACVFTSDNAHCHSQWRAVLSRAVQSCSSSNCGQ